MPATHETASASPARIAALDQTRGLAVVSMIAIHLIPTVGDGSPLGDAAAAATGFVWDKCAGLFCVVAGMAWGLHPPAWGTTLRRAAALGALGIALWLTLWPTEILTPLALMMVATRPWQRASATSVAAALLVVLAAVPLLGHLWFDTGWGDWSDDGRHAAQLEGSTVQVLRYFAYSGTYPLVPWLAFPLVGLLLVRAVAKRRVLVAVLALAAPAAVASHLYRVWSDRHWEELTPLTLVHDSPTTLPYLAVEASWALLSITALLLIAGASRRSRVVLRPLELLGRASLTHYVAHIVLVFAPLRLAWPQETWPTSTGLMAFAGYLVLGGGAAMLWFRRARRGPLESLWARVR